MRSRTLGKNGFEVSEVGLGCWQFGGDFGPMSEETSLEVLQVSVDNGVTLFDTADVYGAGLSEKLIGRFQKDNEKPVKVITKYGRDANVFPDNYTEENMRQSVLDSCERLGTDNLDLLQLHCIPTDELRSANVFDWLRKLKDEGLVKHFGASVETVEEAIICMEHDDLLSLQVIFNIFRQKLVTELLPIAEEKGVGVIVRLPLASGLLAGKFTKDTKFAETDHRNYNRDGQFFNVGETFAGIPFEDGVEFADRIKEMAPDNMSMAQMALRWILDFDAVSTVIPGASSVEQAVSNAVVSDLEPLSEEIHKALSGLYSEEIHGKIRGPY